MKPLAVMQLALNLTIGGTEKLVCDIVRQVDKNTISPVACCLDDVGHFGESLKKDGYPVYALGRQAGLDWSLIRRLASIIRQERIQVIHAHQYTPYFYGIMASLLYKVRYLSKTPKLVFTEHGRFYPDRRKIKRVLINPILSLFTDKIVTISESTKSSLVRYENFPAHRIQVVYNGIELARFSQQSDAETKKRSLNLLQEYHVIGIVARLDPIKNHAMLLRAFEQVLQRLPKTYLLIVGDGPEKEPLISLAQSLNIAEQALFLGARDDVAELYHICDVFALSSFSEGTSVTLLEAMGAGLPIVATQVGGNPEVVQDRETGFLVPSDDAESMAEKLISLLKNETARRTMGQAGRKRAHDMFTLKQMVETYSKMYQELCGAL